MSSTVSAGIEHLEQRALLSAIPLGLEFRANTYTSGFQADPAVAVDADGDLIVTWYSYGQDGDGRGIYARLYDASGAAVGSEFLVNSYTTGSQTNPAVAVDPDGDFVIAWQSDAQDGSGFGIFAQRFNAAGVPQGLEFQVNTFTTNDQLNPAVALNADGEFVIVWESAGSGAGGIVSGGYETMANPQGLIVARRYDSAGLPQGNEFRASLSTSAPQFNPSVALDSEGAFVVAWSGRGAAGDLQGVHMRRFDSSGAAQGPDELVNTFTTGEQYYPSVAMTASGDFVIAWDSKNQDGSGWGVYAQLFNAVGVKQGDEFRVNTTTIDYQHNASVTADSEGDFVVTWTNAQPGGTGYDIYAQRYNAAGVPQGGEFPVNSYTPNVQQYPSVASQANGDFVVAWESFGQDGSGLGVYAQRMSVAVEVASSEFHFATAPHRLRFAFNTDVSMSLGSDDLVVQNLTTSHTIPSSDFVVTYDLPTNVATFTYIGPGGGPVGALVDGNYRATLLASGIVSSGGLTPRADHLFNFFFLRGDANHDGRVNLADFNILADNFGQSPRDFTQGDFNYNGAVTLPDFNLLADRFGQVLFSPASGRGSIFGGGGIADEDDEVIT
jgi:hypothetical protein